MKLPIPIFSDEKIYDECEFKKPRSGVLAQTFELLKSQGDFPAILEFLAGGITSFRSVDGKIIDGKPLITSLCRKMSYISAEVISIYIMLLINKEDWIEGVYECPRCHNKIIKGSGGYEEMDKIADLEIINMEPDYKNNIFINLIEPVNITNGNTGEILQTINSIDMRIPTIEDCINGGNKYPTEGKEVKRQFAIYAGCVTKINGEEIDDKWKRMYGEYVFNQLDPDDTEKIVNELQKYGIKKSLQLVCRQCGKEWTGPVNTSNFFVSGLRS
jgi:hypothetical protein